MVSFLRNIATPSISDTIFMKSKFIVHICKYNYNPKENKLFAPGKEGFA